MFLTLLFLAPLHDVRSQSTWDRYNPGTLAAIMEQHDSVIRASWDGKNPSEHFSGDNFPTIASVIYEGSARPIDPDRLGIVRTWGKTFRRDSTIAQDFHREYLFQEGKQLLWLPVQDTVASFFAKELRPGQRVKLYVMWLGAYYAGRDIIWAFVVNEFEADTTKR
jgi:hypothetical protein